MKRIALFAITVVTCAINGFSQTEQWTLQNVRPLMTEGINVYYHVWSPDGQKIAIVTAGADNSLYVLGMKQGAKPYKVADNLGATGVEWSPDSKKMVFIQKNPTPDRVKGNVKDISEGYIWCGKVVDIESKKEELVASNDFGFGNPRWHADGEIELTESGLKGKKVMVAKWKGKGEKIGRDVVTYRMGIDENIYVTKNGKEIKIDGPLGGVTFSHDGDYLATTKNGICIFKLEPPYREIKYRLAAQPADWSSDDRYILCEKTPGNEIAVKGERGDIYLLDVNLKVAYNLTKIYIPGEENMVALLWPKFSPDSKHITFVAVPYKGRQVLYVADLIRKGK